MCIAISSPDGVIVPYQHLEESFHSNPDGAGFMYAEDNVLHIEKGFMTFNKFYEKYEEHQEKAMAIHFRIATHGKTDKANTHPFQVGHNLGVIHNGIISKVDCSPDKDMSDTYHFNASVLSHIYKRDTRFPFKDHFKILIKDYIGFSKLVFLNNKGHSTIINEEKGVWDEKVWYSNNSYKPRPVHVPKVVKAIAPYKQVDFIQKGQEDIFRAGMLVDVIYQPNNPNNFTGTIKHFIGSAVAVNHPTDAAGFRTVGMVFIHHSPKNVDLLNTFEPGDWVVRIKDMDKDNLGEVLSVTGSTCIVNWIDNTGNFAKPDYAISHTQLTYWWDDVDEVCTPSLRNLR